MNTIPKRKLAAACRMAAESIEEFGWIRNMYGSKAQGFCAAGALNYALDTLSLERVPETVSRATFVELLGEDALKKVKKVGGYNGPNDLIWDDEGYKRRGKGNETVDIPSWNDSVAQNGEEVASFFRRLARHLEHGGHL